MPPLGVGVVTEGRVDGAEIGLEFTDRGKLRRVADVGLDALVGRLGEGRADVTSRSMRPLSVVAAARMPSAPPMEVPSQCSRRKPAASARSRARRA